MVSDIDLVVPWVDGSDVEWLKEKERYTTAYDGDKAVNRFRDWGLLPYLFRGIEKNLPWIRRVHFITWGHVPKWLDVTHPKLNIVTHDSYIPAQYLPTFSSHVIELNLFRISDLSNQFIFANDDMFFLAPLKKTDFFKHGLPCDMPIQNPLQVRPGGIDHMIANSLEIMNTLFSKRECEKKHWKKWFSLRSGHRVLKNIYCLPFSGFVGFENEHIPLSLLKNLQAELWDLCPEKLNQTCLHKFRENRDVNQWLVRYYQFGKGAFIPRGAKGKFLVIGRDHDKISQAITKQKFAMICLSDDNVDIDFSDEQHKLQTLFEQLFPHKSSFEK